MKLIFFAHPSFLGSQSMMRYSSMLSTSMQQRGHEVQTWSPEAFFFKLPGPGFIKKWLGYIDQYVVFRFYVWKHLKRSSEDTLFVFTDQALGPWVPWIGKRAHVIHCHDFLAQSSALGEISENPTKWSGKQYQSYIRRGYQQGENFISISEKTKEDLHRFLKKMPMRSEVVYNALNQPFANLDNHKARIELTQQTGIALENGYILHVGGNQWYKNRPGVVKIYDAFRLISGFKLPLLLIGKKPGHELIKAYESSPFKTDIHFLTDINDELLRRSYNGAAVFIFPSLAEGFGWPIAEAMASGCPVITTDNQPMTEVAGEAGFLIPRMPDNDDKMIEWANEAAKLVDRIVSFSDEERKKAIEAGILNSKRFDPDLAISQIEKIYQEIISAFLLK